MDDAGQGKPGPVSPWTLRLSCWAYFNDYFGIPYPLPKLDHLAIPDFAAGAMENWGAVTYRETALLVDPANSSAGTRQRVAEVVAHEMAHMWFGDLVTMEWWDDLWLNESFGLVDGHQGGGLVVPGMGNVDAVREYGHQPRPQPGRIDQLPPHRAGSEEPG